MPSLATAVSDVSYLAGVSYISPNEYKHSRAGVSINDLVPGGSSADQDAALLTIIGQASAEADRICQQVLAATTNTEDFRGVVKRDGYLYVPTRYWPVLELFVSASVGRSPSTAAPLTSGTDIRIGRCSIELPVNATSALGIGTSFGRYGTGERLYVVFTYVNGWPATTLTADAGSGATSVTVKSPLGIYAGTPFNLYDDPNTEMVTAAATPTTNTIALAAPTTHAHTVANGTGASALPPDVKRAVVFLVNDLIRSRGNASIEMVTVGQQPSKPVAANFGGSDDYDSACRLLQTFKHTGF